MSIQPELGVHLGPSGESLEPILSRLHVLIVGPGMGRSQPSQHMAKRAITWARDHNMPLVLDADALHLVCAQTDLIQGYSRAVLTPNRAEFLRLCSACGGGCWF